LLEDELKLCFDMVMFSNRSLLLGTVALTILWTSTALGAVQAAIKIDQISSSSYGVWTLISADGSARTSTDPGVDKKGYSMSLTDFGPLTLSVVSPPGMSAKITVYRGDAVVSSKEQQQVSVTLYPNDNYRFLVSYSYTRLGMLGVTSDPSGIRFRAHGPATKTYTAKTPYTFKNLPAGQYTLSFSVPKNCIQPPPRNIVIEPEKRNTISQTFACNVVPQNVTTVTPSTHKSNRQLQQEVEEREKKPIGQRK